jgi:hypothetical protein
VKPENPVRTFLLIALQLATSGSDAYFTNRDAEKPHFYELNPIAQPFVRTRTSRIAYFSAGAAAKIVIPAILRKRHHERLATAFSLAGIADNTAAAAFSATHDNATH